MSSMITDEQIRQAIQNCRAELGQSSSMVIAGLGSGFQDGDIVGGLPVVIYGEFPVDNSNGFALGGVMVEDLWAACADMGME